MIYYHKIIEFMNYNMKILILMMTNAGFYEEQGQIMKSALQDIINKLNLQDNISLYSYIGDSKERYIDEDTKTIHLISPDQYDYMYIKTIEALEFVNDNNFEYDFLVRINTSEFINIKLLYELCKIIKDDNKLYKKSYCCELISFNDPKNAISFAPYGGCPILQGKFMMFSKETIQQIIDNKYIFYDKKYPHAGYIISPNQINCIDDICISAVLNIINKNKEYDEYLGDMIDLQIYNKAYNIYYYDKDNPYTYEQIKKYLTICIKDFIDNPNNIQEKYINELHNLFSEHINDNISEEIKINLEKMNSSSVYTRINGKHTYIKLNKLTTIYPQLKNIFNKNEN